jgi:hypothetical protein
MPSECGALSRFRECSFTGKIPDRLFPDMSFGGLRIVNGRNISRKQQTQFLFI